MAPPIQVKFISHSGLSIRHLGFEILIDPWLWSSSLKEPFVRGLLPPNKTIDFQVPEPRDRHSDFMPNAVLCSHYHSHHSPYAEIRSWLEAKEGIVIGVPRVKEEQSQMLKAGLKEVYARARFEFCQDGSQFDVGPFRIEAHFHPEPGHLIWWIKSEDFSLLHMTDLKLNRDSEDRRFDICFEKFMNTKPDLLFIGCGAHCLRMESEGHPSILEHTTLTPVQAARLASLIRPRYAGIMGVFNHSIWKNRLEYTLPAPVVEEQFHWALHHYQPHIAPLCLRPGLTFYLFKTDKGREIFVKI